MICLHCKSDNQFLVLSDFSCSFFTHAAFWSCLLVLSFYGSPLASLLASLVAQSVKNLPAMEETGWSIGDKRSIPGLGSSTGVGNGNPFQYSCLKKSMNRVAWQLLFDFSSIAVKKVQFLDSRLLFYIHLLYAVLLVKILACCLVGNQKSGSLWLLPHLGMRSTRQET